MQSTAQLTAKPIPMLAQNALALEQQRLRDMHVNLIQRKWDVEDSLRLSEANARYHQKRLEFIEYQLAEIERELRRGVP